VNAEQYVEFLKTKSVTNKKYEAADKLKHNEIGYHLHSVSEGIRFTDEEIERISPPLECLDLI
jgi:hypothetical protein